MRMKGNVRVAHLMFHFCLFCAAASCFLYPSYLCSDAVAEMAIACLEDDSDSSEEDEISEVERNIRSFQSASRSLSAAESYVEQRQEVGESCAKSCS